MYEVDWVGLLNATFRMVRDLYIIGILMAIYLKKGN